MMCMEKPVRAKRKYYNWVNLFQDGRNCIQDENRTDRPKTASIPKMVAQSAVGEGL